MCSHHKRVNRWLRTDFEMDKGTFWAPNLVRQATKSSWWRLKKDSLFGKQKTKYEVMEENINQIVISHHRHSEATVRSLFILTHVVDIDVPPLWETSIQLKRAIALYEAKSYQSSLSVPMETGPCLRG